MSNIYFELTWDPDRVLALVKAGSDSQRSAAVAARSGDREAVAVALAREMNALQVADARRVASYAQSGQDYMRAFVREGVGSLPLREGHKAALSLAQALLPPNPRTI